MSVTHTMIGGTVLATVLSLGMRAVLPDPSPIVIHGLTYANGEITQDRTVNSDGEVFFMHWQAEIVSVSTGDPLPECIGDGSFNYKTGRRAATMSLAKWTGNTSCTVDLLTDPAGYYPRATYIWGDSQVEARGPVFHAG